MTRPGEPRVLESIRIPWDASGSLRNETWHCCSREEKSSRCQLATDKRSAGALLAKALEFCDAIAKVLTRLPAKLRKLPLPKLLERDITGLPLRHATTINKMLQVLGAIVSRTAKAGLLDDVSSTFANPFGARTSSLKSIRLSGPSPGWFCGHRQHIKEALPAVYACAYRLLCSLKGSARCRATGQNPSWVPDAQFGVRRSAL
jgi:hypothetical protein